MTDYAELFTLGEDFLAIVARALPAEREAVDTVRRRLADPACIDTNLRKRLAAVRGRYYLLAAAELWCPDCQLNVTAMDFMQQLQPNIRLALITKGRAEEALQQRLGLERIAIPLVLVLDERFDAIGRFIERPQRVIDGAETLRAAYRDGDYLADTVADLLGLIEAAEGRVFTAPAGTAGTAGSVRS
ncbi:MAG: hypothetical protein GAK43_02688 [Stenotrophomonas maltophilia]|nr:MAG: hypothetical protein GAK43_02688 [Stenotrophomonas maltophilia]